MPENGRGGLNQFFHLFLVFQISIKTKQCETFCIPDFYFQSILFGLWTKSILCVISLGPPFFTSAKEEKGGVPGLTFHAKVTPLAKDAITGDWPRFNGPNDNAKSTETKITSKWPESGPRLLWEKEKGEGYASPAIKDNLLMMFHRKNGHETVDCMMQRPGRRFGSSVTQWNTEIDTDTRTVHGRARSSRETMFMLTA